MVNCRSRGAKSAWCSSLSCALVNTHPQTAQVSTGEALGCAAFDVVATAVGAVPAAIDTVSTDDNRTCLANRCCRSASWLVNERSQSRQRHTAADEEEDDDDGISGTEDAPS